MPSIKTRTVPLATRGSVLNSESFCIERVQKSRAICAENPRHDGFAMSGGKRHAAVTSGQERAGMGCRFFVDRQAVRRHHAQCAPGAHQAHVLENWKWRDGAA